MSQLIQILIDSFAAGAARLRRALPLVGIAAYGFGSSLVVAAPLNISQTPLFLTTGVKPNLIMAIDDSGSMDFETLLPGNDGSAWWRANGQASGNCTALIGSASFVGCIADGTTDQPAAGRLNFNNSGNSGTAWKKYSYLFPNGSGGNTSNQRRLADSTNDHFAIPPIGAFGWARSAEFNTAYFDPDTTYRPWVDGGGYTFTNSPVDAARFDPVYTGAGTVNLTRDIAGTANPDPSDVCEGNSWGIAANYYFKVYTGMVLPEGTCVRRSATVAVSWPQGEWVRVGAGGCQVGVANGCVVYTDGDSPIDGGTGTPEAPNWTLADASLVAIRYFPATFYATDANAPSAVFGFDAAARIADGLTPDGQVMYRYEIKPGNFTSGAAYDAAIENFANWFTYYRKRHQALRGGLGQAFQTIGNMRVQGFRINQSGLASSPDVTMLDIDVAANRTALYTNFYYNWTGSGGTPNRPAVANIIRNFKRTNAGAPVIASCQRNFGMLFTDGFSNPPANDGAGYPTQANTDNTVTGPSPYRYSGIDPYADSTTNTIADLAMSAYATNIRPDLPAGRVQPPAACTDATHDPWLDCNRNPHMNFYAITLGSRGLRFDPDFVPAPGQPTIESKEFPYQTAAPTGWPAHPGTWPSNLWPASITAARNPVAVDDLWHAAVNGRGQLLNARRSTDLAEKLASVLRSVSDVDGSAASASVNSGTVNNDTRTFTASFSPKNWAGYLKAIDLDTDGTLGAEDNATIPAPAARRIITVDGTGTAVPFQWGSIGAARQAQLQPSDANGALRLDYLRGDRSMETTNPGGIFRRRDAVMGDIINSAPIYVGAPPFRYKDSMEAQPYSAFFATHKFRKRMVYVGSNGGMLHAFWTDDDPNLGAGFGTGVLQERFAFIPGKVFRNLHRLTAPSYTHQFYVDGTPTVIDAYFRKGGAGAAAWRTVLAGGLNGGGQGIYALDVTDPDSVTEANADELYLWEFTDEDDADLGYTYSRPSVVRMHNGKWAVVFGNGYNNTSTEGGADTFVSATGRAALYIVDLETGNLLRKISLPAGMAQDPLGQNRPNGLATPAVADIDGDDVVDVAYAGDLFGNLWKFDLSSNNPADWDSAIKVAGTSVPMFVARNASNQVQPITTRPQVGRGPSGFGQLVLFGTGKFLEDSDRLIGNLVVQSFYGLYDRGNSTIARASLRQQAFISQQDVDLDGDGVTTPVRVSSALPVNATTQNGWYIDLVTPPGALFEGEMQVSDSVLRNGRISFSSLVPDTDPCGFGGTSWFTIVDALTGSRTDGSPFDLNKDKLFNQGDYVTIVVGGVNVQVPVSSIGSDKIMSAVRYVASNGADLGIVTDTGNNTTAFRINQGPGRVGRQTWRQLR